MKNVSRKPYWTNFCVKQSKATRNALENFQKKAVKWIIGKNRLDMIFEATEHLGAANVCVF